ncbi:acyltransferase family protein [Symmachiella dynata]|nr:acyltransferase [Symmachiella dynata]
MKTAYRPNVDVARLLASVAIVVFHTPQAPMKTLTISGLAYFILLLSFFPGENRAKPLDLKKRATRLLVPWLVWCLFYGVVRLASGPPIHFQLNSLLIGPTIHLWFLPFALLGSVICSCYLRATARLSVGAQFALLIPCVLLSQAMLFIPGGNFVAPFGQWLYSFPLIFLGLGIGLAESMTARAHGIAVAVVVLLCLFSWIVVGEVSHFIGGIAVLLALPWKQKDLPRLRWLAGLSMGIYLLHPFFFLVVYKFYPGAAWYVFSIIGFLGALVTSAVLSYWPLSNFLCFGVPIRRIQDRDVVTSS